MTAPPNPTSIKSTKQLCALYMQPMHASLCDELVLVDPAVLKILTRYSWRYMLSILCSIMAPYRHMGAMDYNVNYSTN